MRSSRPAPGRTALQLARELLPDLILMDVKLPDMSGIDVCRQIKNDSGNPD